MKIKAVAGRLSLPGWAPLHRFFEYLASKSGEAMNDESTREMHVIVGQDLTYGLNILIRDQRKYYQLRQENGKDTIELSQTGNIMEFNYFYFRHDTGAYVFTHYTGCGTGQAEFERLLRVRFDSYRDDVNAARKKGEAEKKGKPRLSRIASLKEWYRYLEDVEKVNDLSISIVNPSENLFSPDQLRTETITYRFRSGTKRDKLIAAIRNAVTTMNPLRGSVGVTNEVGDDVRVALAAQIAVFDRFDFNEYVTKISFTDFHKSKLMLAILQYKDESLLTKANL